MRGREKGWMSSDKNTKEKGRRSRRMRRRRRRRGLRGKEGDAGEITVVKGRGTERPGGRWWGQRRGRGVGEGVEKEQEERIPAESSPRRLEKGVGRRTHEGGSPRRATREKEGRRKKEREDSPRALRDGGSFIPGSRLPTSLSSSPSRISPPRQLPPASTGTISPSILSPRSSLLFSPAELYFPTLSTRYRCCYYYYCCCCCCCCYNHHRSSYSLLLRGTYARSFPGPPHKSCEGNWRVLVSFARESSRTRVSH